MTKEELIEFLRENLQIEISKDGNYYNNDTDITIELSLEEVVFSSVYFTLPGDD